MTEAEKQRKDEYGTSYPRCGNCIHIRTKGSYLMCSKHRLIRDFDSVKCGDYKFNGYIPEMEDGEETCKMCVSRESLEELSVSRGYLTDWYQQSVSEDDPPVWTDKHLDELFGDFYLIPKETN